LVGLGVDELSAAPLVVAHVKYMIRGLKFSEAQALAEFALQTELPSKIFARCQELARASAPGLFEGKI
jgi:phosphotransferase system enzyme I (PtsI)